MQKAVPKVYFSRDTWPYKIYFTYAIAYDIITLMSEKLIGDIKHYLNQNKISQEDFSHRIGVSFCTLNRWLNKKTKPKSKPIIEAIKREIKERIFFIHKYIM